MLGNNNRAKNVLKQVEEKINMLEDLEPDILKQVELEELGEELKRVIRETLEEENIRVEKLVLYEYKYIPVRLQHIFRELGKQGVIVHSTLVYNGRLYIIGEKREEKYDIAPDYEYRRK